MSKRTRRSLLGSRGLRTNFLAGCANSLVIVVQNNAHLVHEADLLRIVTIELGGAGGVDVWEETKDRVSSKRRGLRGLKHGCSCRHFELERGGRRTVIVEGKIGREKGGRRL